MLDLSGKGQFQLHFNRDSHSQKRVPSAHLQQLLYSFVHVLFLTLNFTAYHQAQTVDLKTTHRMTTQMSNIVSSIVFTF